MIVKATQQVRQVRCTRYVTPLREGGSLPAIVEADDEGMYVVNSAARDRGRRRWWRS